MIFSHWETVSGEVTDTNSQAYKIVMGIRERKGMKAELPDFNDYNDKL